MLHANPTLLDTDVEGQKTKTSEKVKELDYTATLIVDQDFSNLKQSRIILDTKSSILQAFFDLDVLKKPSLKSRFFWFSAPFFVGSLALMAQRSCLSKMEMRMHHFGAQSHYISRAVSYRYEK